jgi:hypothetical protein
MELRFLQLESALRLDLDYIQYYVPMFLYVYWLMLCNFLLDNADRVCRIYQSGGVAKKQPALTATIPIREPVHPAFIRY